MSPEELAEGPDIPRVEKAHSLILTVTYELCEGDRSLAEIFSACGRRLRGLRLGLATGIDMLNVGQPQPFYNAVKVATGGLKAIDLEDDKTPCESQLALMLWREWTNSNIQSVRTRIKHT